MITENFLYNKNSKSKIYNKLMIPKMSLKLLKESVYQEYTHFYIKKTNNQKYETRPDDFNTSDYRLITFPKKDGWLSKSQKILYKLLLQETFDVKMKKQKYPYLFSGTKERSYADNAKTYHLGEKFVLSIDLKAFYPSVNENQVFSFYKSYFKLDTDIAKILVLISTLDISYFEHFNLSETNNATVAQGISPSSTIVFLCFLNMFEEINLLAKDNNISMSVYVDDITFSSDTEIPQEFINRLFYIIGTKYRLKINRNKIHRYKHNSIKKVTGVYIHNNVARAAHNLHYRMHDIYYNSLLKTKNISNINEFIEFHNAYFKFTGILNCIDEVEGKNASRQHFRRWLSSYSQFFRAYKKIDRKKIYDISNLTKQDRILVKNKFEEFQKFITL